VYVTTGVEELASEQPVVPALVTTYVIAPLPVDTATVDAVKVSDDGVMEIEVEGVQLTD
jgi:hypothetical protein